MEELFLPEEFLVIGASLKFNKGTFVSEDDVHKYMKICPFPIEYSDEEYHYIKFNEDKHGWDITIPNVHPYILQILTNV